MQVTSRMAQQDAKQFAPKHRDKIIETLMAMPQGGTFQDIADKSGLGYQAVARRVCELVKQQMVMDSGRKGKSPTGKEAIIWELIQGQTTLF